MPQPFSSPSVLVRIVVLVLFVVPSVTLADEYQETTDIFQRAESGGMFDQSYGYAIFPTVGKAGFWVGGAYGKGRVYKLGEYVGDTSITQATVGLQIGAQGFAMIIFFQDKRAFNEFTSGNFEFNAQVSATAITAGVSAGATTTGTHSGASAGKNDATASGAFYRGMAVYTIARGGLMAEASVGGQKFTYTPR